MMQNLRLSIKLGTMVIIPIIGLLLFGFTDVQRRIVVSREMNTLQGLARLAMAAHRVAGALYEERSMTAGSLTANESLSAGLLGQYQRKERHYLLLCLSLLQHHSIRR